MSASLRVVSPPAPTTARPAGDLADRIRQLQAETRALAAEQVAALAASLRESQLLAEQVADGGDAYPPGVRDLARRLADESASKVQTIEALMTRA